MCLGTARKFLSNNKETNKKQTPEWSGVSKWLMRCEQVTDQVLFVTCRYLVVLLTRANKPLENVLTKVENVMVMQQNSHFIIKQIQFETISQQSPLMNHFCVVAFQVRVLCYKWPVHKCSKLVNRKAYTICMILLLWWHFCQVKKHNTMFSIYKVLSKYYQYFDFVAICLHM